MSYSRQEILYSVAKYYSIESELISGKSLKGNLVKARQMYCYLCKKYTDFSLCKISKIINRDHATVIHSVKKINNQIKLYPDIQYDINQISLILFEIRENNNNLIPKDVNLLLLRINHTNSFIKTI